ncbi:unnamed protein product [Sphagnum troendelagicum]|uniref:Major facilitator superfamily (MFS) profile domain-containing protein n=1 Tax=Sphagnum troendelagicum TaxID=128251 RepID=A0ABP0U5Y7_9BRYO
MPALLGAIGRRTKLRGVESWSFVVFAIVALVGRELEHLFSSSAMDSCLWRKDLWPVRAGVMRISSSSSSSDAAFLSKRNASISMGSRRTTSSSCLMRSGCSRKITLPASTPFFGSDVVGQAAIRHSTASLSSFCVSSAPQAIFFSDSSLVSSSSPETTCGPTRRYTSCIGPITTTSPGKGSRQSSPCQVATSGKEYELTMTTEEESGSMSFWTTERAKVVMMVAVAMALCNADRVIMSVAIVPLSVQHNWSTTFSGIVQSSFLWGYLLSPIGGGALADRYGGKSVMGLGVAVWSLATLLTPWAAQHSLAALLTTRVLMGLAEGVAMPCMNNMISKWFPQSERSRAVGITMAGFHLGSVAGLVFTPSLMLSRFGLSAPFAAFGLVGFVWLFLWLFFISKDPQSQPRISRKEYQHILEGSENLIHGSHKKSKEGDMSGRAPPFGVLLSKLPTWAIIVANFMNNWGYFILLGWMPVYFNTVLGVNLKDAAWFSAVPWAMMAAVGFIAGACADFLIQSGVTVTTTRKIMQSIGFLGPAFALLGLNAVKNPTVAAAWLTAAVGLSAFSQAGFLVNHQEIGPKYAGVLHGMSNTAGTVAAIVSTMGVGVFIECLGSFQSFLSLTSIMYIGCTVFWVMNASGKCIFN